MIVIEGPDGAGKSTLVKWITETYDLQEGERSEKNRDYIYRTTREDTWKAMHTELQASSPPLVWDRLGPWSDPIYAPLMGREVAFTRDELLFADNFIRQLQCSFIICLPPLEVVKANVEASHQIKAANDHIEVIYNKYRRLGLGRALPIAWFDYTTAGGDRHSIQVRINSYLQARKEREQLCS